MNTRATSSMKKSLEQQCIHELRQLSDVQGMTEAQEALYQRLSAIESPLDWEPHDGDEEIAQELWKYMSQRAGMSIQIAAIMASLRGLKAVAAAPVDGYI